MRQLGTLPDAQNARTLADYLQSHSIDTRVDQAPDGWIVWVCDEDKLPQAREEFQEFQRNPADARFRQPPPRPERRRKEDAAHRRSGRASTPWAIPSQLQLTLGLIVLSVLVTLLFHSGPQKQLVTRYLFILSTDYHDETKEFSWLKNNRLDEVQRGEVWRLVTPIFVHFDILHLAFNMYWLWFLGGQIERRSGSWRLGLLILLLAVASNVCQYFFSEVRLDGWPPTVGHPKPAFGGMSGVGFGLFGYVWMKVVYEPNCGLLITRGSVMLMMFWLVLCMTGLIGPVANTAHLVGLSLGMIVGYLSARLNNFGQRNTDAP